MLFLFLKNVSLDFDLEKTIVFAGKDLAWYFLLIKENDSFFLKNILGV